MKPALRHLLALFIIAATVVLFVAYTIGHPQVVQELRHLPLQTGLVVFGLYVLFFVALVTVLHFSLVLYGHSISMSENFLVSAYSSLANFFGPGQSGPGVRAVYLKKRHNIPIKQFMFASLVYYACYACVSGFLLLVGNRPWWQTGLGVAVVAACSLFVIRIYMRRARVRQGKNFIFGIGGILAGTVIQAMLQIGIYWAEIHGINPHITLAQIISYTGAANFSLFVALTPGAIGIREAFLIFSQSIHHIDSTIIVTANIVDRAVYVLFLGLLFVSVLGLHGQKALTHFKRDA